MGKNNDESDNATGNADRIKKAYTQSNRDVNRQSGQQRPADIY
jgi:hypothetical protein